MHSFQYIREADKTEKPAVFFRPLGLSKKFMLAQHKTKLDDGATNHPYLRRQTFIHRSPQVGSSSQNLDYINANQKSLQIRARQQGIQNQYMHENEHEMCDKFQRGCCRSLRNSADYTFQNQELHPDEGKWDYKKSFQMIDQQLRSNQQEQEQLMTGKIENYINNSFNERIQRSPKKKNQKSSNFINITNESYKKNDYLLPQINDRTTFISSGIVSQTSRKDNPLMQDLMRFLENDNQVNESPLQLTNQNSESNSYVLDNKYERAHYKSRFVLEEKCQPPFLIHLSPKLKKIIKASESLNAKKKTKVSKARLQQL